MIYAFYFTSTSPITMHITDLHFLFKGHVRITHKSYPISWIIFKTYEFKLPFKIIFAKHN